MAFNSHLLPLPALLASLLFTLKPRAFPTSPTTHQTVYYLLHTFNNHHTKHQHYVFLHLLHTNEIHLLIPLDGIKLSPLFASCYLKTKITTSSFFSFT
jgi:hypothetical protein